MPWPDQQPAKLSPVDALRLVRELAADSANVGLTQHCRARMHGRRIASCSNCSLALKLLGFQLSPQSIPQFPSSILVADLDALGREGVCYIAR
jgi:hypothetical protein